MCIRYDEHNSTPWRTQAPRMRPKTCSRQLPIMVQCRTAIIPFPPPARGMLSNDGRLYLRSARHPVLGCSTLQARPFRLALDVASDGSRRFRSSST